MKKYDVIIGYKCDMDEPTSVPNANHLISSDFEPEQLFTPSEGTLVKQGPMTQTVTLKNLSKC